jgi:glycosyltransferase involved in cell wall biosynthesis
MCVLSAQMAATNHAAAVHDSIDRGRQVALVLWSGEIGGAETFTLDLAAAFQQRSIGAHVLLIAEGGPLNERLDAARIPASSLNFRRGRDVLTHARTFARRLTALAPDGAILPSPGFIARAARIGGYGGVLVGIEHGSLIGAGVPPDWKRRIRQGLEWRLGVNAVDRLVCVSDAVATRARQRSVAVPLYRVYCGVNISAYPDAPNDVCDRPLSLATVSRLAPGKGLDVLINAVGPLAQEGALTLDVFGEGPARARLEALIRALGLEAQVRLRGLASSPVDVWRHHDICVFPATGSFETFGRAAVEAMAGWRPVIASRVGGLEEIVSHGVTGFLVQPGSVDSLRAAVLAYSRDRATRVAHGVAGRQRAATLFDISHVADTYLQLLASDGFRRS